MTRNTNGRIALAIGLVALMLGVGVTTSFAGNRSGNGFGTRIIRAFDGVDFDRYWNQKTPGKDGQTRYECDNDEGCHLFVHGMLGNFGQCTVAETAGAEGACAGSFVEEPLQLDSIGTQYHCDDEALVFTIADLVYLSEDCDDDSED